jgi:hypothetical protein
LAFGVYRQRGFFSYTAWDLAWGSQGVVVLIRTLAVWEVTRSLLSAYSGVWGLASKILLAVGIAVSFACMLLSRRRFYDGAMDADRGFELSLAVVIVFVFLFLRYYGLEAKAPDRQLALGFCLFAEPREFLEFPGHSDLPRNIIHLDESRSRL